VYGVKYDYCVITKPREGNWSTNIAHFRAKLNVDSTEKVMGV
jgi:hypothetical protein